MLTLISILLAIRRRKIRINNTLKEIIYTYYNEEIDDKRILRRLTDRYHFGIDLDIR